MKLNIIFNMERLPVEMQELLCRYLDGDSLLCACRVSPQWNIIISSFHSVWRQLCLRIGTGPLKSTHHSWKRHYIYCRQLLKHLKQGHAFQHRNFIPESFRGSAIRGLVYANGHLIAGIHNHLRIWRVADLESVGMFDVPYKVSCLAVSRDGQNLAIGRHSGAITTWNLQYDIQVRAHRMLEFLGHTSIITALSLSIELNLLCSGSTDRTARLWNLQYGNSLWTVTIDSTVLQIMVLPSHGPTHKHMLFIADDNNIHRFSWLTHVGEMEMMWPQIASERTFLVHGNNIFYVQDGFITVQDWYTGNKLHKFALECADIDLIAVGSRFLLLSMWDNLGKRQELVTIDISDEGVIGKYAMPLSEYIVAGETDWLNGLASWKPGNLVIAASNAIQATDCFYVATWRNSQSLK